MAYIPTEQELRQILATILAGATGKAEAYWNKRLGVIAPVALSLSPATNWRVALAGAWPDDERAINQAVALVRGEHPYVSW
jgi:hypothetical protein